MALFDDLPSDSRRTEPLVWVRRLVLYERLDPPTPIRDIPLHTGMNIVWGMESEDDGEKFTPGHGVGKTTFCRMIRYCLGEARFGQKHTCHEVHVTFPEGYVAAEISVDGQAWVVLRPFNAQRASYAQADVAVEQILETRPPRNSFNQFREQLSATSLRDVPAENALTTGGSIQWDHLLAMCSRDQEARYQSIWQWRTSRSDSDTPSFSHPKTDALLCVRAVLGLLPAEEITLRRTLRRAEVEISNLVPRIAERQREPEYWVRELRKQLRRDFEITDAEEAPLEHGIIHGLPNLVENRVRELDSTQQRLSDELDALERQISIAAAALKEPAELRDQLQVTEEATQAGTCPILESVRELETLRQLIRDAESAFCKYGRVSIGECSYAQQQVSELDREIVQAQQETVPEVARRDQIASALRDQHRRLSETVNRLQSQLNELIARRRGLEDDRRRATDDVRGLRRVFEQLQHWEALRSGTVDDSELQKLQKQKQTAEDTEETTLNQLQQVLQDQDKRADQVRQVFDSLVKTTLSDDFNGIVQIGRDDLVFRIARGESMSGEAFETLAILLSDLTTLFLGALGLARHPCLLIHDSPREADLGATIYRHFLTCAAAGETKLQRGDQTPFQYIVTTTTEPPDELQANSTTSLRLGGEHGLLFRCQLATERVDPQGNFWPEES